MNSFFHFEIHCIEIGRFSIEKVRLVVLRTYNFCLGHIAVWANKRCIQVPKHLAKKIIHSENKRCAGAQRISAGCNRIG